MATAAYNSTIRCASGTPIAFTDEAASTSDQLTYSITNTAKQFLDWNTPVVVQARYDEIQSVTITGSPTGGTFVLRFGGQNTSALNWNCTAAQMQTALQNLSSVGPGNALVTGGPGPGTAFTVEFTSALGYASQAPITLQTNSLTGGTSPNVAIAETQAGSTWGAISGSYTQYNIYARVVFGSAQAASTQIRFHSGNYLVIATLATTANGEFAGKNAIDDTTVFSTTGSESSIPTTFSGTLKFSTFNLNSTRVKSLKARERLIIDVQVAGGDVYTGYCWTTDSNIKSDPKKAVREDLAFKLTDEFYAA